MPGVYQVVLDTDALEFEGQGRVDQKVSILNITEKLLFKYVRMFL